MTNEYQIFPDIRLVCGADGCRSDGDETEISVCIGGCCEYSTEHAVDECVMITEELTADKTKYHTVCELFISNDNIVADLYENTIAMGIAWKTVGDILIVGGLSGTGTTGGDEYWTPKECSWPRDCNLIATPLGLYSFDDYFAE